jgi:hydroxymethylpyrimidine pyrophosphatase-like HAD family hydrolase
LPTLYITDLDGTLLRGDSSLSPYAVEALNRMIGEGLMFSVATSRARQTTHKLIGTLNLSLPVVLGDGVFITDLATGRHRVIQSMARESWQPLFDLLRERDISPVVFSVIDGAERASYLAGREGGAILRYLADRPGDPRMRPVSGYGELFAGEICHITLMEPEAIARALYQAIYAFGQYHASLTNDTYHPEDWYLAVLPAGVTKASGVLRLKELAGADRIVCFGDNLNDLPMFAVADEAYAVANAKEEVKAAATGVILSNEEDGVVRWLERI